jgi:large subunit ribosomal protein L30
MAAEGKIRVRLVKSQISTNERQRQTCLGLGLRKIGDSRVLEKTPAVLGMVKKVAHLIQVEESNGGG